MLAHVPPGQGAIGYARSGLAPVAVLPTAEMLELHRDYSWTAHLVTAAHEIGHLLWDFNHPSEEGRTSDHDLRSLMSHRTVLDLSVAYLACYQRQQEGWADNNCSEPSNTDDPPVELANSPWFVINDEPMLMDNVDAYNWYKPPADVDSEGYGENGFHYTTAIGDSPTLDSWAQWDFDAVHGRYYIDVWIPDQWATAHVRYDIWVDENSNGFAPSDSVDGPWIDQQAISQEFNSGFQSLGPYDLYGPVRVVVRDNQTRDHHRDVGKENARLAVDAIRLRRIGNTSG